MKTVLTVAAIALMASMALGNVRAYAVDPVRADWSDKVPGNPQYGGVGQRFAACYDTLVRAELFAGEKGAGGTYVATVKDWETGDPVAISGSEAQLRSYSWVSFDTWTFYEPFVRSRSYSITFTRNGNDSIEYFWDNTDPYFKYGGMIVPGENEPLADLACRVFGVLDTICTSRWGALSYLSTNFTSGGWDTWAARADTVGLPWMTLYFAWDSIQRHGRGTFAYDSLDAALSHITAAGVVPHGLITHCPSWASSRGDTVYGRSGWSTHCPPRNLWDADSNFWAEFVDSLVDHVDAVCGSDSTIHVWHCLNEENDTGPYQPGHIEGWFMHPDSVFYPGVNTGLRGLCSLYMRMASVMASVIRSHSGHEDDTIVIGDLYRGVGDAGCPQLVSGRTWLDMCYQVCETARFWDAVAVHPYQGGFSPNGFDAEDFAMQAETLRQVMRDSGDCSELWADEIGWCTAQGCDSRGGANNLAKSIMSVEASAAAPGGGYDLFGWWHYWQPEWVSWYWSFISPEKDFSYPGYAYACLDTLLGGKRFNGRVLTGDPGKDTLVRVYEFEDAAPDGKKLWCGFRVGTWGTIGPQPVAVALPARTDETDTVALAYDVAPPEGSKETEADGWLACSLTARPVFYSESGAAERPDLRVDSVKLDRLQPQVGMPLTIRAWVKNHGDRATPGNPNDYPTACVFSCNGESIGTTSYSNPIDTNSTVEFEREMDSVFTWMHGQSLFSAAANPKQTYVEKAGLDDNSGYKRAYVAYRPTGDLNAIWTGRYYNVGLIPLLLSSHDWESDSTGDTPCESARLFQWRYGGSGGVIDSAVSGWFGYRSSVVWRFLLDEGRYRFGVVYSGSGGNLSDTFVVPDSGYLFFDTIAPPCSVVINHGARFTKVSVCTLALWASDTLSHVAGMRIGNQFLVNVVENSGFTQSDGHWEFSGGDYGDSLALAELPVDSGAENWVRQFIPAESIQPFIGDTCVLSADLVIDVPDSSEAGIGALTFSYRYANTDTTKPDAFVLLCTDSIYGGVSALVGLAASETSFVLPLPLPPVKYVWAGAMVKIAVGGLGLGNRTGTLWADNARLDMRGPVPKYSWWQSMDSSKIWNLGSGDSMHRVWACFQDSAGNENVTPVCDSIILDAGIPDVMIHEPENSTMVNGTVDMTGWAYDPIVVPGDTWFRDYRLFCRHAESTEYVPITPDSVSYVPAYPDTNSPISPYVHLGYWDTEVLENADYWLKLTCTDSAGNLAEFETWVTVFNQQRDGMQGYGPEGGGSGLGEGSVLVGSATGRIVRYDENLDSLESLTLSDSGNPAYVSGILSLDTGHLLVADARTHSLSRTTRQGQDRTRLVSNLGIPAGITQDGSGNIWLCDRGSSRIAKFSSSGNLLLSRGGQNDTTARLNSPEAIAVKSSLVYVSDAGNNRIAVWDTAGNFKAGISGSFQNPRALAITDSGTIYTIDHTAHAIEGLNQLGGHLVTITTTDTAPLKHLLLSSDQHSIFTLRPGNNRILKYRVKSDDTLPGGGQQGGTVPLPKRFILYQPWPNPAKTRLNIRYGIPRATRVTIKLFDIAGKLTRTLASDIQKPGYYNLVWNRTDNRGRRASAGVYFCTLSTDDKRLSRKVVLTQ